MKNIIYFLLAFLFSTSTLSAQTEVNICVDQRIELFRIVYNLAVMKKLDTDYHPAPSTYEKAVAEYFKPYKKHKAVKKMRREWIGDYSFPYVSLELGKDFNIPKNPSDRLQTKIEQYGFETIQEILWLIKDFAAVSNFENFYQQQQSTYAAMLKPMQMHFDTTTWINDVATFFKMPAPSKINIYFDPLNNIGNSEIHSHHENEMSIAMAHFTDKYDISNRSKPVRFQVDDYTKRIFYHEATHYFTSDLTYSLTETFRQKKHIFLEENHDKNVRDIVWMNEIDETIVRAITAYLYKVYENEKKGKKEIDGQTRELEDGQIIGYVHAFPIYQLLDQYTSPSSGYENFEDFHKEIVELILEMN